MFCNARRRNDQPFLTLLSRRCSGGFKRWIEPLAVKFAATMNAVNRGLEDLKPAKGADLIEDWEAALSDVDAPGAKGIARDLAAAGIGTLKSLVVPEISATGPCAIEVRTDDPEGCPLFLGRSIAGVRNGVAPDWMVRRLTAIGQRPISTIVDITNYVMFDLGRPSHAYDLAKLGGFLAARKAHDGEQVTALNGKTYTLTPRMTVIADAHGAPLDVHLMIDTFAR